MKNKKEQNQDKIGLFLELFTEDNNKLKLDIKNYLTKDDIDFIIDILILTKEDDILNLKEKLNQESEAVDQVIETMTYFVTSYKDRLKRFKSTIENPNSGQ